VWPPHIQAPKLTGYGAICTRQASIRCLLLGRRKNVVKLQNFSSFFTRSEGRVVQRSVDRLSKICERYSRYAERSCIFPYLSSPGLTPTLLRSSALSSLRVKRAGYRLILLILNWRNANITLNLDRNVDICVAYLTIS